MVKLGRALVIAGLSVLLGGCSRTADGPDPPAPNATNSTSYMESGESRTHGLVQEGIAQGFLQQDDPNKPLMLMIGIHALIFFIDRDNPNLPRWVAIVEESQRKQVPVRFTYEISNQRLTALELKP